MSATDEAWTIGRLLTWTIDYLRQHGAENPRLDAEVLLAAARRCRRIELYTAYDQLADEATRSAFREMVRRRAAGTPVAYLVGHREFYSLEFEVTPDVLIPRPETELVVVALLDHVKQRGAGDWRQETTNADAAATSGPSRRPPAPIQIGDVGTGSGILAVCAAKYVPNSHVKAIDISPAALAVARRNAERHGVADRIEFVESDLLNGEPAEPQFDYIVSNPPYVSTSEMTNLAADVRDHEPDVALRAGERGTDVIEPLIEQSALRLKPGGALIMEVSPMIAAEVEQLIRESATLNIGPTLRDLAGHPRVVQGTRQADELSHHRGTKNTE